MNNNDDNEYEVFCQMCHRAKSQVNDMFKIIDGMYVCSDCMHKTMDTMEHFGFPKTPFGNVNGFAAKFAGNNDTVKETSEEVKTEVTEKADKASDDNKEEPEKEAEDSKDSANDHAANFGPFPGISFLNMSDIPGIFGQKAKVKKKQKRTEPLVDLSKIPAPHKIKELLDEYVIGQEKAKKAISVAVYNHYKRVASDGSAGDKYGEQFKNVEIEKSNMLLIGPTGCGKTYLVKTLAKLLDVPLAITDATSLTEAGYIGDDIESVVSKLLAAADNDVEKAETGIIFIDEIDKIAKKKNTHSRDVSGESVQQGMLKLLEGSEVEVPVGSNSKNAMVPLATVNTKNILFICGGAFPELDEIIKQRLRKQTSIGFNAELRDDLDKRKDVLKEVTVEDIKKFGMIPEFVGRLPVICTLEGLTEDMLVDVLKEPKSAIIKQYQKLLAIDEVELIFDDEALHEIAKKAMEKDTGARALRSIIEELMLDIMYEIPKDDNIGRVTITKDYILGTGGPVIDLRSSMPPRIENEEVLIGTVEPAI